MSRNGKKRGYGKRFLTVLLTLAMIVSLTPSLGALTGGALGAQEAYAETIDLSGEVNASDLTMMGDYILTDDTTINVDSDKTIGSIDVGDKTLLITGDTDSSLSVWGTGIKGTTGKIRVKSGTLDVDCSADTGRSPAAIDIPSGTVEIAGGGLFVNFNTSSSGASTSCGINCGSFIMDAGETTVTCNANTAGNACGIQCVEFQMLGGSMGVTGIAGSTSAVGYGISTPGFDSNANFHLGGGSLSAVGETEGSESYGIGWYCQEGKTFVVDGGASLSAKGDWCGIFTTADMTIDEGADVTLKSSSSSALDAANGASLTFLGIGTKLTATSTSAPAIAVYGNLDLSSYASVILPENGYVDENSSYKTVFNTYGNPATHAVIESLTIPTDLAITYDATKAFPTTRLTGHQVSLHLLRNVTTNPGKSTDGNGWYVFGADPEKADFEASPYTCLVRKTSTGYETLENSDEALNDADEYYFCFNIEDDQTRPFAPDRTYTVTVNAEPADEVVNYVDENGEGQLYVYKKVELDEAHDVAWSARVSPQGAKVTKGANRQFSAKVYGATKDSVTWSVSENESAGTYITSDGVLYAASDESASSVMVTATSVADPSISDSVYVGVVDYEQTIDSVQVRVDSNPVCRGTGVWLHAVVEGSDIHDLKWEVIGSDGKSYFSQGSNLERLLVVGQDEPASELTVRATSVADPTKYDEVTIQLKDKDTIQGPINLTFDGSGLSLTDEAGNFKTGKQVTKEFRNTITSPYGESLTNKDAPGGWYVFGENKSSEPMSQYTSLVRKLEGNTFDETLYQSTESLSADGEYYLWFNVEDCESTHQFDYAMDLASNITVNGIPVNGETVFAKWGGEINVYARIVKEPGWVKAGEHWYYYESNTAFATNKWMKKDGAWAYLGADGKAEFKARDIQDATVTGITNKTYTGEAITQTPVVKLEGATLEAGTDYTVSYKNNTKAGEATVTITGEGNYTGTVAKTFKITPAKVTAPKAKTGLVYNGKEQTGVAAGTGYTVKNGSATNAGSYTATVALKDKANYTWSDGTTADKKVPWEIAAKPGSKTKVTVPKAKTGLVYTGKKQTGVAAGTGYTVKNGSATKAGDYTATLTLKDKTNYTWSDGTTKDKSVKWSIKPVALEAAKLGAAKYTWSGKEKKPKATVTAKVNGAAKTLEAGTDYTITYKNNKNVGKATVTIKGKGNYSGTKTKTFKINPKGTTLKVPKNYTVTKTAVTVKWDKQAAKMSASRITGYQVQVATNKGFTAGKKSVKVKGYSNVSKKFTKLKSGKKYYVRIRTYKVVDGTPYYSPWSAVKTVTIKK